MLSGCPFRLLRFLHCFSKVRRLDYGYGLLRLRREYPYCVIYKYTGNITCYSRDSAVLRTLLNHLKHIDSGASFHVVISDENLEGFESQRSMKLTFSTMTREITPVFCFNTMKSLGSSAYLWDER